MTSTQAQIDDTLMGSQPLSPGSEQGGESLVLQVLVLPVVHSVLHGGVASKAEQTTSTASSQVLSWL